MPRSGGVSPYPYPFGNTALLLRQPHAQGGSFIVKTRIFALLPAVVSLILLSSCATTKILGTWKNPGHRAQPRKILIIGMSKSPNTRVLYENEFVRELKGRGIEARAGHTLLSEGFVIDPETLRKLVNEQGIDTVLVTRLVDRKTAETVAAAPPLVSATGFYQDMYESFGRSYENTYYPGYVYTQDVVSLETDIYDVASRQLVWRAFSSTFVPDRVQQEIQPFVQVMMKRLIADKIIP